MDCKINVYLRLYGLGEFKMIELILRPLIVAYMWAQFVLKSVTERHVVLAWGFFLFLTFSCARHVVLLLSRRNRLVD